MMKSKTTISKNKIEHRGFDVSATKYFDLEMKMVMAYNKPLHTNTSKITNKSRNKEE